MHCRAYLLLERDFQELMENNYKGIIAFPVSEDMMQWEAEIEGLQYSVWHVGNGSSVSSEEPQEFVKSVKDVSFNDYYETWSVIATSNTTEYYRTPVLQDPDFIGRYYQWKKTDLKQAKEWRLKYVATLSQLTRENKTPQKSKYPTTRIHVGPTPDKASPESQMETDIVAKIFEEVKVWEGELSPPEYERSDMSWEEEVEDLVSWANTLNTNTLED
ncbi:ubiquitin-conjugating enzyme E2 U isoform X2 [Elephas maximus indicus]|uniref:ubiquitin-conjugating enzyme E2 U isoform X2 n=1 Tax=Elephas maximus indicus TaxID=99487 RepID=UPI0021160F69|nr:ubiquitin-conjugating enzyme E2 U isoform X2 [Elephas maximus indicus]